MIILHTLRRKVTTQIYNCLLRFAWSRKISCRRIRGFAIERFFEAGPRKTIEEYGKRFIILDHNYSLDIDALCNCRSPHEIWVMSLELFTGAEEYFPFSVRDLKCIYKSPPMIKAIKNINEDFVHPFVNRVVEEVNPDILLVPSDIFYWFRPFIEEFQARGVPVVVQDKEGTLAPGNLTQEHGNMVMERYPPIAKKYLFWCDSHQDFWVKFGYPDALCEVSGQPRSDFFMDSSRWPSKQDLGLDPSRPMLLAFTYAADAYVELMAENQEGGREKSWSQLRRDYHEELLDIASENPDWQIVFKAHPQQWDLMEAEKEIRHRQLPNVFFLTGAATANPLIANAQVVVGFQTTAILEAMMTSVPIIYAGWGETHGLLKDKLIPIHRTGGCLVPNSRKEFEELCRAAMHGKMEPNDLQMQARRREVKQRFVGDGHCSERVLDAAVRCLPTSRS